MALPAVAGSGVADLLNNSPCPLFTMRVLWSRLSMPSASYSRASLMIWVPLSVGVPARRAVKVTMPPTAAARVGE